MLLLIGVTNRTLNVVYQFRIGFCKFYLNEMASERMIISSRKFELSIAVIL